MLGRTASFRARFLVGSVINHLAQMLDIVSRQCVATHPAALPPGSSGGLQLAALDASTLYALSAPARLELAAAVPVLRPTPTHFACHALLPKKTLKRRF